MRKSQSTRHRPRPAQARAVNRLTRKQVELLIRMVREGVGMMIGFVVISLFFAAVLASIWKAFITEPQEGNSLLNTVLTLVSPTLSTVLGYFLGRSTRNN